LRKEYDALENKKRGGGSKGNYSDINNIINAVANPSNNKQ
jgi:hypothetical protein